MKDDIRQQGKRNILINEIRNKRITDSLVLDAMSIVPRHFFMDSSFIDFAYKDSAFPIGEGQTISQPYTVAFQSSLLKCQKGDKVLEIGTGSGYQAAVLAQMGVELYTIERQEKLYLKSKEILRKLGYRVNVIFDDGHNGAEKFAPYDKILVTAAATKVPENLLLQLKIGGMMVVPIGSDVQIMTRITRETQSDFVQETFGKFSFVPMLQGVVKK